MRRLLPPLIAIAFTLIPPGSQAQTSSNPDGTKWQHQATDVQPAQAVTAEVVAKKPPFRKRHPKVWKSACLTRTVCLFVSPVLDVVGKVLVGVGLLF